MTRLPADAAPTAPPPSPPTLALRRALGGFATGVTVVTTHWRGVDWAMTCNSFTSVSLEPPLVLWSIQRSAGSREAFEQGGGYTVSVLGADQAALVLQFSRGPLTDRFAGVPTVRLPSGRLRLAHQVAWFDCALQRIVPAGDHDILLAQVQAFEGSQRPGLVFEHRRLTRAAEAGLPAAGPSVPGPAPA